MSPTVTRTRKRSGARLATPPASTILSLPAYKSAHVPTAFFETANSQALAYGLGLTFKEIRPSCVDTVRRHVNCSGAYRSCRYWESRSSREKLAAIRYAIQGWPTTASERSLFVATSLAGCLAAPELLIEWLEMSFHEALEVTRGVRHDLRHWRQDSWGEWKFEFQWDAHRFRFPVGVTDWDSHTCAVPLI